MRCPSLLTKAAGLTSSSRSRSTSCRQHLRTCRFETNFQSLAKLTESLFLPWIITPGSIHTASGTYGMSKKSSVKFCSTRSSRMWRCPQMCVSSRLRTSQMNTHSRKRTLWSLVTRPSWHSIQRMWRQVPAVLQLRFWTDQACADVPPYAGKGPDDHVAGIFSPTPGRLCYYMTGHYLDEIPYVKVPAFWSTLLNSSQLQH